MRLEPLNRQADWVALTAVICGVAPVPLVVLSVVPFASWLTTPLLLLAIPAAIGFGIAGVVRARSQPEPNYVLPLTGLVLSTMWILLGVAAFVFFSRGGGFISLFH